MEWVLTKAAEEAAKNTVCERVVRAQQAEEMAKTEGKRQSRHRRGKGVIKKGNGRVLHLFREDCDRQVACARVLRS